MLPILEGEDFNGEPPNANSVPASRAVSPSFAFISPSAENSSVSLRASQPLPRASSPALLNDAASSAPASSLASANCSRPTTAAVWSPPKNPAWQHHGAALRNSTGPPLLSAVVHSGTTTLAPLQSPSTSSWRTASVHLQDSASGFSSNPPAGVARVEVVGAPDLTTTATGELLAAAAARLHNDNSQEPLEFPHSQQSQPQQQSWRGPEQALQGPFRGPPPPPSPGQQNPGDQIVPWDTPGRELNTPLTAGYRAGVPPPLNTGAFASGLLFPYNDVRRQLGTRRVPSVVLETSSRRLLPSRDTIVSPVSPSKLGEGLASPQHPPALALAPLPSHFNTSPNALSCCNVDSSGNTTEHGASTGHGSHHQRQLFTPTTVSFARPAAVTLQPMNSRHRSGPGVAGFSCTMSAPLPSPTAVATSPGPAGAAQRPRGTLTTWGNQRTTHGSPPPVDVEGPDQSLGLWNHCNVPVRVATVVPTLSIERADGLKSGLTHGIHSQHMRQNAGGGGGGGGAQGSSLPAALGKSSCADLTSSLRSPPQLQPWFHQRRHSKHDKLQQPEAASQQDQEQPYQLEEAPGFIIRSLSLVLSPSAPRFMQLPQGAGGGASPGSPKGRATTAVNRATAISSGLESRPSTSPPSPNRSLPRSPPRSPGRSPPRSPGRQPGAASTTCMQQSADASAATTAANPGSNALDTGGTGEGTTTAAPTATAAGDRRDPPTAGQASQPHNVLEQPEQQPLHYRELEQDEGSRGIVSVAGSIAGSPPPPLDMDTGSAAESSGSGEAKQYPGKLVTVPLPMPPPQLATAAAAALRRPHVPYSTAGASFLPSGTAHASNNAVLGPARAGAGGAAGAPYGGAVNSHEGRAGRSPIKRMASKENGGLLLLNVHNQQRLHQHLQQHLQEELQQLQAEAAEAAEAAVEAAIGARTFSLRRTVYNDWVEGMPLKETRRGGGASVGGVVASGLEGKSVVLKRQPMERPSGLVFKHANRKPPPGSDALHAL